MEYLGFGSFYMPDSSAPPNDKIDLVATNAKIEENLHLYVSLKKELWESNAPLFSQRKGCQTLQPSPSFTFRGQSYHFSSESLSRPSAVATILRAIGVHKPRN